VMNFPTLPTVAAWVLGWYSSTGPVIRFVCIHSGHTHFVHRYWRGRVPLGCPPGTTWSKRELEAVVSRLCAREGGNPPNAIQLVPPARHRSPRPEEFEAVETGDIPAVLRRIPVGEPVTIVATSMWFVVYQRDPALAFWHEQTRELRVCLSFHADALEKQVLLTEVRKLVPPQVSVQFSPCSTRTS
jgi:hypothetical protein